jgi:hypothetical protein
MQIIQPFSFQISLGFAQRIFQYLAHFLLSLAHSFELLTEEYKLLV